MLRVVTLMVILAVFQPHSLPDSKHGGGFLVGVQADDVFPANHVVAVVLDEFMEVIGGRFINAEFF